ncbi:MAG: 3,4-dihydroxy-2-butanone-4-phosphate synthase [Gammaproteobacteria bacterium]|nr:3,4-dihydroxy-2-butanone-4-phosphate synthase [Gammaproteobacteria bacterium]
MALNTAEELIEDIRQGKMVILMDDEDRENEGDLVLAAACVRPEDINFMARYARGLICLTLTREHCKRLNLPLMASNTYSSHTTNFTVSIEAAEGVTTGISAADRSVTIQKAVAQDAKPSDLIQPGHVFPLMAHPGGVLSRAGHTEAGCDLARLAGLTPAAVIVEILKDDGTMARRPDLELFAKEHHLKIGTIAGLIHYRIENEKTVERVSECDLPTEFGDFRLIAYRDGVENDLHFAMVKGQIDASKPTLVRVHVQNPVCDLTGSLKGDCGWPIRDVLSRIAKEGEGVIVILCNQIESLELINQLESYSKKSNDKRSSRKQQTKDLRTIGLGAQILSDLGVRKMRVLSAPKKMHAISGFGLEVIEYVS